MNSRKSKLNLNFDYNNLIKNTKINSSTVDIANLIMDNTFYEAPQYDKIEFGNKIKWDYQHSTSANSYQIYIHSLNMISYLTDAYLVSKDIKYLKKAYSILRDWQAYNQTYCKVKKNYVWCDHSTTFRTINILYFYLVSYDLIKINHREIYSIIIEHLDYLNNFPMYTNDNHGIMIDRTLLLSSFILNDKTLSAIYFTKSYYRLREAFFRDFSEKGIHLENSIDYHCLVKRLFKEINAFLIKMNMSLGDDITSILYNDTDYLSYVEKPDLRFPLIGDTSGVQVNKIKKRFDNFIDTTAGIAIFQKENTQDPTKSLWLSFICGYGNSNHKHNDDLSILLSNNGYDLFVDAGKYNYNRKDPLRIYCKSVAAHNTIQIGDDTKGYEILTNATFSNKPHITDFFQGSEYNLIKGINASYPNAYVERTVILIKSAILIIYDAIKCTSEQDCIQSFNLAPGMTYNKVFKNKFILTNNDYDIIYEQHQEIDQIDFKEADVTLPQAVISETFSTLTNITQVKAHKKGINNYFLTSINLDPTNYQINKLEVNNNAKVLTIEINEKRLEIFI